MLFALTSFSQLKFSDAEILLHNQLVWRGQRLGTGISIEPSATVTSGRFSFNAWAAFTADNSYTELDLVPSYQFDLFSLSLLDYYIPVSEQSNKFLNFKEGQSRHSLELTIDNYSIEKQRFKWMVGTFFAGDRDSITNNSLYSTYLEFKYPFTVLGIDVEPVVGLTPFRGLYADNFAFVNTGISLSKELQLSSRFSIPLAISFIHNPYLNVQTFVVSCGISFSGSE